MPFGAFDTQTVVIVNPIHIRAQPSVKQVEHGAINIGIC